MNNVYVQRSVCGLLTAISQYFIANILQEIKGFNDIPVLLIIHYMTLLSVVFVPGHTYQFSFGVEAHQRGIFQVALSSSIKPRHVLVRVDEVTEPTVINPSWITSQWRVGGDITYKFIWSIICTYTTTAILKWQRKHY